MESAEAAHSAVINAGGGTRAFYYAVHLGRLVGPQAPAPSSEFDALKRAVAPNYGAVLAYITGEITYLRQAAQGHPRLKLHNCPELAEPRTHASPHVN